MNTALEPGPADELSRLEARVSAMRSVLAGLMQEVALAEHRLAGTQASLLMESNERLVVAALQSRENADSAFGELETATRRAERDTLTQLPNRALLLDRCAQAMAGSKRHGTRFALLFLDLDRFKQINDELGHAAGDEALLRVARRLSSSVRAVDTVSRLSGDEFVVLLTDVSQPRNVADIAESLLQALAAPAAPGERALRLQASIGISLYPDDGDDVPTLLGLADAAMYQAKRLRPGGFVFHGQEPTDRLPSDAVPKDRRHDDTLEANGHLIHAAIAAQALQTAAEQALRRQRALLMAVAGELRNPYSPVRVASALLGHADRRQPMLPRVQAIAELQLARLSHRVDDLLSTTSFDADVGADLGAEADAAPEWPDAVEAWLRALHHDGLHAPGEGGATAVLRCLAAAYGGRLVVCEDDAATGRRYDIRLPPADGSDAFAGNDAPT